MEKNMTCSIEFKGDLTCSIQSADMDAAIQWYQSMLGFQLMYRVDEIGWCELTTPVSNVTVGISQVETPQVRGGATLVFGVRDIDAARAELEGRNVRFDGETMTIEGMVRLATFFDIDGNKYMLSQSLQ
jgi:predicted enzyme related to lactoylglutathione lyase